MKRLIDKYIQSISRAEVLSLPERAGSSFMMCRPRPHTVADLGLAVRGGVDRLVSQRFELPTDAAANYAVISLVRLKRAQTANRVPKTLGLSCLCAELEDSERRCHASSRQPVAVSASGRVPPSNARPLPTLSRRSELSKADVPQGTRGLARAAIYRGDDCEPK